MTPTKPQLLALADVVEGLPAKWTVEYRAVAKEIHRALFGAPDIANSGYGWREDDSGWWMMTGQDGRIPPERINPKPWLTSLDTAIQLVPTGMPWMMECKVKPELKYSAFIYEQDENGQSYIDGIEADGDAASPSLSLTAAALRALAHQHD